MQILSESQQNLIRFQLRSIDLHFAKYSSTIGFYRIQTLFKFQVTSYSRLKVNAEKKQFLTKIAILQVQHCNV